MPFLTEWQITHKCKRVNQSWTDQKKYYAVPLSTFMKVLESGITVSVAHFVSVILEPRSLRAQSHTDMVCSEPSSTATNKLPPSCNIKRILIKLDSE